MGLINLTSTNPRNEPVNHWPELNSWLMLEDFYADLVSLNNAAGGMISGTPGAIPYFNTATTLADSLLSQSGANISMSGVGLFTIPSLNISSLAGGGTQGLVVDNSGNVTVGASGWALDGNTVGALKYIGTNDAYDFPFYTDGTEWMRLTTTGKLGIGTTNPSTYLDVSNDDPATAGANTLTLRNIGAGVSDFSETGILFNTSVGSTTDYQAARIYAKYDGTGTADSRLSFQTLNGLGNLVDIMSIKDNKVGIGTSTPTATTHIQGVGATSATYSLKIDNSSSSPSLHVNDAGQVGIGSSPSTSARLYVDSTVASVYGLYVIGDNTNVAQVNFAGGSYGLLINTNNTTSKYIINCEGNGNLRFRVQSDGLISMPSLQVGNGGLSVGDLYVDTSANVLANGDYVVARKV